MGRPCPRRAFGPGCGRGLLGAAVPGVRLLLYRDREPAGGPGDAPANGSCRPRSTLGPEPQVPPRGQGPAGARRWPGSRVFRNERLRPLGLLRPPAAVAQPSSHHPRHGEGGTRAPGGRGVRPESLLAHASPSLCPQSEPHPPSLLTPARGPARLGSPVHPGLPPGPSSLLPAQGPGAADRRRSQGRRGRGSPRSDFPPHARPSQPAAPALAIPKAPRGRATGARTPWQ